MTNRAPVIIQIRLRRDMQLKRITIHKHLLESSDLAFFSMTG
jgi:hypothetical protein